MQFDGLHSCIERRSDIGPFLQLQEGVVPCLLGEHEGPATGEVGFDQRAFRRLTCSLVGFNRLQGLVVAVTGLPQEQ
jgi:hypothetical protein